MDEKELHAALEAFTSQHCGQTSKQAFFRAIHRLSIKGMGIGHLEGVDPQAGERGVLGYVHRTLSDCHGPDFVLFDVGANCGVYTKMARAACPDARIFAFEPSPTAFSALASQVSNISGVKTFPLGMSSVASSAPLFHDKKGSGMASLFKRQLPDNLSFEDNEIVDLTTIDDFCSEHVIDRIGLLKIDTEGNELEVLKGAKRMLENGAIDFIQFEFGGCAIDSRIFLRDFFNILPKFDIYRILVNGIFGLKQADELEEIFCYQNFLAIKKA